MTLAPFVRILGVGPGRARSLTEQEAEAAMGVVLRGEAAPEAVGALLMLMRMKGETPDEIAGFVRAARAALSPWEGPRPGLDWPSYAAGRTRGQPWFLLAARLVAASGVPVLLHGWNGVGPSGGTVRAALPTLGIPVAADPAEAGRLLAYEGLAYLPLEALSPPLLRLVRLREVLGLRSCINTVLRMLNPGEAPAAVQGVFHPPYLTLQSEAAGVLGLPYLTVLKGGGGEFERHPCKDFLVFGRRAGADWSGRSGAALEGARRLADAPAASDAPAALWRGDLRDGFAEATVLGTAALALETLGVSDAAGRAAALWGARASLRAA